MDKPYMQFHCWLIDEWETTASIQSMTLLTAFLGPSGPTNPQGDISDFVSCAAWRDLTVLFYPRNPLSGTRPAATTFPQPAVHHTAPLMIP